MKRSGENNNKTILTGAVIAVVSAVILYMIYSAFFSGSSTPPPPQKPVIVDQSPAGTVKSTTTSNSSGKQSGPGGGTAGVDAQKLASTSSSLDPTLDESAMLRTESLVYSGSGRNIFSALYTPPPPKIPTALAPARPKKNEPPPPPPVYVPPPPPPINLKFFGTANAGRQGPLQAFLLSGEDVFLASQGDIVAHKYKIGAISANSVQVTDLQNNNTQTLPRIQN